MALGKTKGGIPIGQITGYATAFEMVVGLKSLVIEAGVDELHKDLHSDLIKIAAHAYGKTHGQPGPCAVLPEGEEFWVINPKTGEVCGTLQR